MRRQFHLLLLQGCPPDPGGVYCPLVSRYMLFAAVGIVLIISTMSGSSVAVAFPQIASSFDASVVLAGWVLGANQLATVAVVPIAGKISDSFGRRRTFLLFIVLFTVGSALCAIAPNIYLLILFRLVQGAGAGCFLPASAGILAETFPESRQRSVGLIATIGTMGNILGPNVGGWLTDAFGWQSVFWFCVPVAIAGLIACSLLMKKDTKVTKARIDTAGAALFAASVSAVMVGLTLLGGSASRANWASAAGLVALGIAMMVVFLRFEARAKDPIIEIEALRRKPFMAANAYNFIYGITLGAATFVPLYVVSAYGMSTIESGLVTTPRNVMALILATVTSFFLVRWGYRKPLIVATLLVAAGSFVLGIESHGFAMLGIFVSGTLILVTVQAIIGTGAGIYGPASTNACIELMPEKVSTLVGIRRMFLQTGSAFGITITSAVLSRFSNPADGFPLVFIGTAVITLLGLPLIMAMPRAATGVQQRKPARSMPARGGGR